MTWPPEIGLAPYYADDWTVIYNADCREIIQLLPKVDLVLTDPPYGHGKRWQGGTWGAQQKYKDALVWDVAPSADTLRAVVSVGNECVIWGGNYFASLWPSRGILAWIKTNAVPTMADLEIAWTTTDRPAKAWHGHNNRPDTGHATSKPLPLMSWCLGLYPEADTVLDPFMGSGTTLRAAKDLNRHAIGVEISEAYCEIAARRMSQEVFDFTGSYG